MVDKVTNVRKVQDDNQAVNAISGIERLEPLSLRISYLSALVS